MNKLKLSILSFGILFGSAVFAQETKQLSNQKMSKEQQEERHHDNVYQELNLTAAQREKIIEIRKRTQEDRIALKKNQRHSLDKSNIGKAMEELRYKENADISKVLNAEQLVKFEAMNGNGKYNHVKGQHHLNTNQKSINNNQINHSKSLQNSNKTKKQLAPAKG